MRHLLAVLVVIGSTAVASAVECVYESAAGERLVLDTDAKTLTIVPTDGDGDTCAISRASPLTFILKCPDAFPRAFRIAADGSVRLFSILWEPKGCPVRRV